MGKFATAFSENLNEKGAIREIALKIKSFLPRHIDFIIVFFTPHYSLFYLHYCHKMRNLCHKYIVE